MSVTRWMLAAMAIFFFGTVVTLAQIDPAPEGCGNFSNVCSEAPGADPSFELAGKACVNGTGDLTINEVEVNGTTVDPANYTITGHGTEKPTVVFHSGYTPAEDGEVCVSGTTSGGDQEWPSNEFDIAAR